MCLCVLPAQSSSSSSHRVVHTNVLVCSAGGCSQLDSSDWLVGYICIAAVAPVKVISFDSARSAAAAAASDVAVAVAVADAVAVAVDVVTKVKVKVNPSAKIQYFMH